ncbi:isochorismate synthase MenF [Shewanella sp. YIC-542]|uniref:isochorismate synthase n=1 Tax=Shewanella mytili TaxID=3377111 RepID=UPI00398E6112
MSVLSLSKAVISLSDRLSQLLDHPQQSGILQLVEEVTLPPLMSWLATQQHFPKIYWQGRDHREEVAAIGSCLDLRFTEAVDDAKLLQIYQQQRQCAHSADVRFYGGVAFDRRLASWPEFGRARFLVPRVELRRSETCGQLIVNLNLNEQTLAQQVSAAQTLLAELRPAQPLTPPQKTDVLSRTDMPDFPRWSQLVTQVTSEEFNRETPKVVLSRQTKLQVSDTPDPWTVLACWQGRNPTSFQFGFQFSAKHSFISCTPERLYRRQQDQLVTEALAGTTVRGLTPEEDEQLAQQLLDDHKNSHENQFVGTHIVSELTPLSARVNADEPLKVFKLNHIQHLHRVIKAHLRPEICDFQLLQSLHPTPAVGGFPKASALDYIAAHEGYNRGWYAGTCGFLSSELSEFAVAIRSALLEPGCINLFAGAGILTGSDPALEWQELENKLATIMSILVDF